MQKLEKVTIIDPAPCLRFGEFVLDGPRRLLERGGVAVKISSRAFDILEMLVRARAQVVSRSEIIAHVWAGLAVEEHNLSVQMSILRRILGDTREEIIATVPGRGYRFVAVVETTEGTAQMPAPASIVSQQPAAPAVVAALNGVPIRKFSTLIVTGIIACLVAAVVLAAHFQSAIDSRPRLSIAVLPFRALGDDSKKVDLADAITDDLHADLSHLPRSVVTVRASAQRYQRASVSVAAIGRALNVRYLVDGSVALVQGRMSATIDLIDTVTGRSVLPTEQFVSALPRLWDAKSDIERRALQALDVALVHAEVERAGRERPDRQDALDLFFHARSVLDRGSEPVQLVEAQHLLERAIAAEPDFVEGLSTLGWVLTSHLLNYDYDGYSNDADEADRVTARALALAPRNPDVLAARGRALTYRGELTEAQASFEAALSYDPNDVWALTGLAVCVWRSGKADATIDSETKLLSLDPQSPATGGHYETLGLAALFSGRFELAIKALLRDDAADGDTPDPDDITPIETTRLFLIAAYELAGDQVEAQNRYAAFRATWQRRSVWREMALFYAQQSRMPLFTQVCDALEKVGMPRFADEHEDSHVAPTTTPLKGGDFAPTPRSVPVAGAGVIDTQQFVKMLARPPAPIVVDIGRQCVAINGAILLSDKEAAGNYDSLQKLLFDGHAAAVADAPIVVLGSGSSGGQGYNFTLRVADLFHRNVFWYRGGEEAWAAFSGIRSPPHCQN